MIIFATCVSGNGDRYRRYALPAIQAIAGPQDQILELPGDPGICAVYNQFIRAARAEPDCEALVLLHDDVEVIDPNFRLKLLAALRPTGVGLVGVIGASQIPSLSWWESKHRSGLVFETRGLMHLGERLNDVDVVDGLMLAIAPRAFRSFEFDQESFPKFHGYDVDFALQLRDAGLRVRVAPIDLFHRTGETQSPEIHREASKTLWAKWPHWVSPPAKPAGMSAKVRRRVGPAQASLRRIGGAAWPKQARPVPDPELVAALALRDIQLAQARTRMDWLRLYLPHGEILELGSGSGKFLRVAGDFGFHASGIEPNHQAALQAQDLGVDITTGELADWIARYPGLRPDAVAMWGGLEQVADPASLLGELANLLRPGGILVLEVPNFDSDDARRLGADWDHANTGEHRVHFSPEGLARLVTAAGLQLEHVVQFSSGVYESPQRTLELRNAALLERVAWPSLDLLRIIARATAPEAPS